MTIPVDFGQGTFVFNGAGVPTGAVVTLGFENAADQSAVSAAEGLRDAWVANIMPLLTEDVGLQEVRCKLGPEDTGPSAVSTAGTQGGDTDASTSPNTAILVSKITGLGGRRGRGRMFVPGVNETEVSEAGALGGGYRTALQAGFDALFADLVTFSLLPVLLHDPATEWVLVDGQPRRVPDAGAPAAPAPTSITDLQVSAVAATQRRRLRR